MNQTSFKKREWLEFEIEKEQKKFTQVQILKEFKE